MANRHRGEVGFECGGKSYVLRYSTNSLCDLEGLLNKDIISISELMSKTATLRMSTVRAVFWAGMLDQNPDITIREAGELMTELGYARSLELVGQALGAAFPDTNKGTADASPRVRPEDGTGPDFSDHGANSGSPTISSGAPHQETLTASLPQRKLG